MSLKSPRGLTWVNTVLFGVVRRYTTSLRGSWLVWCWYGHDNGNVTLGAALLITQPRYTTTCAAWDWWRHRFLAHAQYEGYAAHAIRESGVVWGAAHRWHCTSGSAACLHRGRVSAGLPHPQGYTLHDGVICGTQRPKDLAGTISLQSGTLSRQQGQF